VLEGEILDKDDEPIPEIGAIINNALRARLIKG
jgi:hypothetical protein